MAAREKHTALVGWRKSCCHPAVVKASCDGQDDTHILDSETCITIAPHHCQGSAQGGVAKRLAESSGLGGNLRRQLGGGAQFTFFLRQAKEGGSRLLHLSESHHLLVDALPV